MNKTIVALIAIVLILGSLSGFLYTQKSSLEHEVSTLTSEKEDLTNQVSSLNEQINNLNQQTSFLNQRVSSLNDEVENLTREKTELQNTVYNLKMEISRLKNEKSDLTLQLNQVINRLNNASANYEKWEEYLLSYSSCLNYTVKRVFSDGELEGLRDLLMSEVLSNPEHLWDSYQDIYNWITSNICYVNDEPFPWPPEFNDFVYGNFSKEVVFDSIMAPSETLELRQGDCDDQATLAYAMIKSYERYIHEEEYTLWLMALESDDEAHLAVAFPATGSNNQTLLTIIDPAGHYSTELSGKITAKDPFIELNNYKNYWSESEFTIKTVTLYKIVDGVAYVEVSDNVQEVASYIANL